MNNWIFLSKEGKDEYVNMFAIGSGGRVINTDDFDYRDSDDPIILRGIVKNDLQHSEMIKRPDDRFRKLAIPLHDWKKGGRKILIAKPDEKPMKFYGLELDEWLQETIDTIKKYTDRPIEVRERVKSRVERTINSTLKEALDDDVHCLVTFNSNSATEAVMYGYPSFTLSPTHAASPVTSQDLSKIETPFYPDKDLVYAWACHLAYGQFHINELKDGSAWRILNE